MDCNDLKLSLYADGELAERAEMEAHLAGCQGCRTRLEEFRRADALLTQAADRMAPPVQRRMTIPGRRSRRLKAVATAAVLLLGFCTYWGYVNLRTASPQEVRVIGATELIAGSRAHYRVLVTDHRTGAPVVGAKVEGLVALYDSTPLRVTGATDAQGSAEIEFDVPGSLPFTSISLRVDSALGHDELARNVSNIRPGRMLLSTDKPIYQPGQAIHIRALGMNNFTMKPLAQRAIAIEVEDPNGNKVFKKELMSSDFGIAAADFVLADEVTLGRYRLRARAGEKVESERTVEVKRYVLPKFRVDIKTSRPFYVPGETLSGSIDAQYGFKKPVSGAAGRVTFSRWLGAKFEAFSAADVTLDEQGHGSFTTDLPREFYGLDNLDAVVRVEASVTDKADHRETSAIVAPVAAQPLRLIVIPEHGDIVPGIENAIYVVAVYPDGRPARCTINDRYQTDETGVARLVLEDFNQTMLKATDATGRTVTLAYRPEEHLKSNRDFAILLDQATYRAGATASVTALAAFETGTIYLDLVKTGQTLLTKAIDVRDHRAQLALDLPAEISGTVHLTAYHLRVDGTMTRDARVFVVDRPGDLRIRCSHKPTLPPGKDKVVTLDLELVDSQGRPVPGALSVDVVDEMLFAILEAHPGLEREFFQIQEELLKPRWQIKNCDALTGPRPTPVRCSNFEEPNLSLLGRIDYSVKQASLDEIAAALNRHVQQGLIVCFGIMVGLAVIYWGALAFARPGAARILFAIMFVCVILGGAVLFMPASRKQYMESRAGKCIAPMAGDPNLPRESAADKGQAAPRVREFFPETLYWNPEIVTDDKGRAQVKFPGADSITTWRIAMSAVTKDGRLGAGEDGLTVFQPFFVDLDLPVTLTQGDEIWAPVAVYNYLKDAQEVELEFTAESGFEVLGGAKQQIAIAANEVLSTLVHLKARDFGRHKLKVEATGGLFSDAIRREIEVLPDGKETPFSKSERLDGKVTLNVELPADAIDGATRARLRLFPSTFSDIVTGLDRLVQMPYG